MQIIVKNNIEIIEPNQDIWEYCYNQLTIDNPTYITAKKLGKYLGNIPPKMKLYYINGNKVILPFGCLNQVWKIIKYDKSLLINQISPFKPLNLKGNINLYMYQKKALEALKMGKNGILEAPCGSGKTQIGLALIKSIGGRALWLTHTEKLLNQSLERCRAYYNGDFGTITQGGVNIGKDITFATVQTMSKIDSSIYMNEFSTIIVDECHHCVGSPVKVMQFYKVITNCNCRYKYGLSATLQRGDNLIDTLYTIIGEKLYTINKSEVGDKTIKAKHIKYDINIKYNYIEYLDSDGTINYMKLIDMLSFNQERNNIIIENILMNKDRMQLVLCHRVKQVEILSDMLNKKGIKNTCITGKVKQSKREYNADVIVATYALAKEGLDIPMLEVLHLATPQKNESTTVQAIGRIERNIENKRPPVCFDYVDVNVSYCLGAYKKRKRFLRR